MDYGDLLKKHQQSGADVTLGTTPVDREAASSFGIMQSDARRHICRFEEKPKDPMLLDKLRISPDLLNELGHPAEADLSGVDGFSSYREVLIDALANDHDDFGKHIIPASLRKYKVFSHIFQEYWEDIGTVRAFFEANLALTDAVPTFNFFDQIDPIYTPCSVFCRPARSAERWFSGRSSPMAALLPTRTSTGPSSGFGA